MHLPTASADAAGSAIAQVVFDMVDPSIYRRSAFRLTGLPVDASPRDIRRRSEELAAVSRLGGTLPARRGALMPLRTPPDADEVQEAIEVLRQPDRRLVQELFWFWPGDHGEDRGLTLLAQGDTHGAATVWEALADDESAPPVEVAAAVHNLAVLCHAMALDAGHGDPVEGDVDELWGVALYYWQTVVATDLCWHRLAARVRQLSDPRLTPQAVDDIRAALPRAVASISATLAADALRDGDVDRGLAILDKVEEAGFPKQVVDGVYERVAEPLLAEIRRECKRVVTTAESDRSGLPKAIRKLLAATERPLSVVDMLYQPGHVVRDGVHDEVALTVLGAAATAYGKSLKAKNAGPLIETAIEVAATATVKERLRENLATVEQDLQASMCWFCGENPGSRMHKADVSMYGDVAPEWTPSGVRLSWQRGVASVPRCGDCATTTADAGRYASYLATTAVLLGFVGLIVFVGSGLHLGVGFAVGVVVVFLLVWRARYRAVVRAELDRIMEFPAVDEHLSQGWSFGERPPGTA